MAAHRYVVATPRDADATALCDPLASGRRRRRCHGPGPRGAPAVDVPGSYDEGASGLTIKRCHDMSPGRGPVCLPGVWRPRVLARQLFVDSAIWRGHVAKPFALHAGPDAVAGSIDTAL